MLVLVGFRFVLRVTSFMRVVATARQLVVLSDLPLPTVKVNANSYTEIVRGQTMQVTV